MKEYIVTLHRKEDLDDFYDDMETPGGNLHIPDRKVECQHRREISRNTHYMLTEEEAEQIRQDHRVLCVELTPDQMGIEIAPMSYTQSSSNWDKSFFLSNSMLNWGLLRCWEGSQRANWGSNGTGSVTGTVSVSTTGANVDVVIVDGHIDPNHPEYGGRVIQRNWFASQSGTYTYTPYVDGGNADRTDDNNHGAHVAGTVAGETQGWARGANIYNINPYGTNVNGNIAFSLFDYVREFHNTKSVNPQTGRKNPTIVNNSWGFRVRFNLADVSSVNWRGNVVSGPFTESQLIQNYGIDSFNSVVTIPVRVSAIDADIQDAINDGIIVVGSAGNDYMKIDVSGGADYNNTVTGIPAGGSTPSTFSYHRGNSPGSATGNICVGSIGTLTNDSKSQFSNTGPRVDIYAPGSGIISSVHSGGVSDSRNGSYFLDKKSGTSMASPQVCGVLALALELYPNMNQADALSFIQKTAGIDQITATSGGYDDFADLQGSPNYYLAYKKERPIDKNVFPKNNFYVRETNQVYPRTRIRR